MKIKQLLNTCKNRTAACFKWAARPAGGAFAVAVEYLTCLPAWWVEEYTVDDMENSPMYFPVVGLIVGLMAGLVIWLFSWFAPPVVLGVLGVVILMKSTGGQGSIGMAAAFSEFFTSPLRKKVNQPLAEPAVLSGGIFLAFALVAGKMIMLCSLSPGQCARGILLAAVAGRCGMLLGMALSPCVEKDDAVERIFWKNGSGNPLIIGLMIWGGVSVLFLWTVGLFAFVFTVAYAAVFSLVANKILGGMDRKSLFALSSACEFVTILILVIGY